MPTSLRASLSGLSFLQILGNVSEFQRVVEVLQDNVDFDIDVNASVFETNIRGEGCLLGPLEERRMWNFGFCVNQEVINRILSASLARALGSSQIDRVFPPVGLGREVSGSLISFRHESEQGTEKRLKRNMPGLLTYLTYIWYQAFSQEQERCNPCLLVAYCLLKVC